MENTRSQGFSGDFENQPSYEALLGGPIDISAMEKVIKDRLKEKKPYKADLFSSRLEEVLEPTFSAKELIERIIKAAIEVEFGHSFVLSRGFDNMVSTIADSIITNPDLRRSALSIASSCIGSKIKVLKQKADGKKDKK